MTKDKTRRVSPEHMYDPKDFMYSRKGPWPQPSPEHPWGESPAVVHIPWRERLDFSLFVSTRYFFTILFKTLPYYIRARFQPGLKEVTDDDFTHILNQSMLSKFITPKLDDIDKGIFHDYLEEPGRDWFIIDLEAANVVKPFEGIYVSGSKTLLYKEGHVFKPRCIYIDKTQTLFEASDGDGWELAKYFVLQGGALCATLVAHPLQHFPFDSINAVSKTSLPKAHIVSKLLRPHFRFTLPLEDAVLNYRFSIVKQQAYIPFAPYPGDSRGLRRLLVEGYQGIKGNHSYPPFSYSLTAPHYEGDYGEYLTTYYDVFYRFVEKILIDVEKPDFWIGKWADYAHLYVNDFPASDTIFEGDTLVRAVTTYLFTVTVGHSVDHYNYGVLDKRQVPLRIRQEPPFKGIKMKPRKDLVNAVDQMKYDMADSMFFSPSTITRLIDAKYNFDKPSQQAAVKEFKEELIQAEKHLLSEGINYMPLKQIAASIQF